MVKPFFDRRVGWGIAGWRYLARMGLDRRMGQMVRAVHQNRANPVTVLGRNAGLARRDCKRPLPPEVIFPFGATSSSGLPGCLRIRLRVRRMAVHRKPRMRIRTSPEGTRAVKKTASPSHLATRTQVVDAQLTHRRTDSSRFCEPLQYTVCCPSQPSNAFFLPPCRCGRCFQFLQACA